MDKNLLDWWECAECGETGRKTVSLCPSCGSMQIGSCTGGVELPPCWKESTGDAAAVGANRLFVHLDGPGFIGIEDGTAELVTADLAKGEEPNPETRDATAENVRELAEKYNNEFYGEENGGIVTQTHNHDNEEN